MLFCYSIDFLSEDSEQGLYSIFLMACGSGLQRRRHLQKLCSRALCVWRALCGVTSQGTNAALTHQRANRLADCFYEWACKRGSLRYLRHLLETSVTQESRAGLCNVIRCVLGVYDIASCKAHLEGCLISHVCKHKRIHTCLILNMCTYGRRILVQWRCRTWRSHVVGIAALDVRKRRTLAIFTGWQKLVEQRALFTQTAFAILYRHQMRRAAAMLQLWRHIAYGRVALKRSFNRTRARRNSFKLQAALKTW
jgi:hypothetical protein